MGIDRPGFTDPVADAQASFRAILDALAHPGRIAPIAARLDPPAGISPAAAAVLLTLVDAQATLALPAHADAVRAWVAFHCGARAADPAVADFVLASDLPDLAALKPGTDEEPEQGATLLLDCPTLTGGATLCLRGPGIEHATFIAPPLPRDFPARWQANQARFPRGIDLILCAGDALIALPRGIAVVA